MHYDANPSIADLNPFTVCCDNIVHTKLTLVVPKRAAGLAQVLFLSIFLDLDSFVLLSL